MANGLQFSCVLIEVALEQGAVPQEQYPAVAMRNDADRIDVAHSLQRIGDLFHAVLVRVEHDDQGIRLGRSDDLLIVGQAAVHN